MVLNKLVCVSTLGAGFSVLHGAFHKLGDLCNSCILVILYIIYVCVYYILNIFIYVSMHILH